MQWAGWSEFWAMGGHGYYVWMSYAAAVAAIALEVILLKAARTRALRNIEEERELEASD